MPGNGSFNVPRPNISCLIGEGNYASFLGPIKFSQEPTPRYPFPPLSDWLISPLMGHMLPKPIWGSEADEPCGKTKHSHSFKKEITEAQRPHCLDRAFFFFFFGAKMCLSISIIGLFTPISPLWYYIWSNGQCRTAGCIWRMVKQTSSDEFVNSRSFWSGTACVSGQQWSWEG